MRPNIAWKCTYHISTSFSPSQYLRASCLSAADLIMSRSFSAPSAFPPLIPIMVGNTSTAAERRYGEILAPYLLDPTSIFVISSDFCHWGSRFRYTYYQPPSGSATSLRSGDAIPSSRPLHESIAIVDQGSIDAVETGSHEKFWEQLDDTGNTVCGRHPIGVLLSAVEALKGEKELQDDSTGKFRFVRYERSELCRSVRDSSVSYCSAFAVI